MLRKPRGMRDFPPEEAELMLWLETKLKSIFKTYGYERVIFPTVEYAELFELKSGEEIREHMYVFEDKGGRRLCLRPEATASIARMFGEGMKGRRLPLRLYYYCQVFRYEEPQRGRYREFWHFGAELLGSKRPEADAEVVELAARCMEELKLTYKLEVGHLGILRGLMGESGLSEEQQNEVLSLLDRKEVERAKQLCEDERVFRLVGLRGSPKACLKEVEAVVKSCEAAEDALLNLHKICELLSALDVNFELNLGVVRGLDYYTGMVFEAMLPSLGTQAQVCGGGRYDGLIPLITGLDVPAVGFAFGFDRLLEALRAADLLKPRSRGCDVYVAPAVEGVEQEALRIASELRKSGWIVEADVMGRRLQKSLEHASARGARLAVIVGRELSEGWITVKDMRSGEQQDTKLEELQSLLSQLLGRGSS